MPTGQTRDETKKKEKREKTCRVGLSSCRPTFLFAQTAMSVAIALPPPRAPRPSPLAAALSACTGLDRRCDLDILAAQEYAYNRETLAILVAQCESLMRDNVAAWDERTKVERRSGDATILGVDIMVYYDRFTSSYESLRLLRSDRPHHFDTLDVVPAHKLPTPENIDRVVSAMRSVRRAPLRLRIVSAAHYNNDWMDLQLADDDHRTWLTACADDLTTLPDAPGSSQAPLLDAGFCVSGQRLAHALIKMGDQRLSHETVLPSTGNMAADHRLIVRHCWGTDNLWCHTRGMLVVFANLLERMEATPAIYRAFIAPHQLATLQASTDLVE
ncbi:hypothetical protein psal_cds_134 [Pandoravirus salinus]|uniref:Uncharacterized protein n=1 Tax=Pandoravirus salinus TaxID=1349410 RepID=S4VVZ3_9VIRU|nr:Pup ligase superfamily incomplete domain [Pandoravirus salinus]AGO83591.2 hypothetical protein psal_cds_134 [Pandoravirus salinus]